MSSYIDQGPWYKLNPKLKGCCSLIWTIPMITCFCRIGCQGCLEIFQGCLENHFKRRCGDRDPPWFTTRMLAARSLLCLSPGSTFLVLAVKHKNQWLGLDQQNFWAKYYSTKFILPPQILLTFCLISGLSSCFWTVWSSPSLATSSSITVHLSGLLQLIKLFV